MMIETTPDLLWLKSTDGVYLECNPAFARFFGVPVSEIIGKTDYDFLDREIADSFREHDQAAMTAGAASVNEEWITYADDGRRALVETVKTPLLDDDGGLIGVLGVAREVTEVRAIQAESLERERYLRALIDNFPFLVWLKDTESRFLAVNQAFVDACGAGDSTAVVGKMDDDVWPADLAREYAADDLAVMESRRQKRVEEAIVAQGRRDWWETYKAPVVGGNGELLGTVGFAMDISDRKNMEEQLRSRDALMVGLARATDKIISSEALTDHSITSALEQLGLATGVDRVYIFEHTPGTDGARGFISQRYEWSLDGVEPQIDNPDLQDVAWEDVAPRWYDVFVAGGHIAGNVADFPECERAILEPQEIVSLLALPIDVDGVLWGFVGFDACGGERAWTTSEAELLRSTAKSLTAAIGRMRMETALRESEQKFRTVADFAYDWEAWSAPDGTYRWVSPSCERITGHAAAEFMADPNLSLKLAHPDDRSKVVEHFRSTADESQQHEQELEYRIVTPDGQTRWISHWCVAVHGDDGQWLGRRASNRDVTDRRLAESALRESEENFRTFFETDEDMVLVGSPDGRIVYANGAVSAKLGYEPAELLNMMVLDLNPTDRRAEAEAIFGAMFAGERDTCPLPLQAKSGALLPAETRVWFGKWNGEECIFGIAKDLSAEQEALQRFDQVFRSNPTPMALSCAEDQKIEDANDSFLAILGYKREEVIGSTSVELGLFVDPEVLHEVGQILSTDGRVSEREVQVRCKNGSVVHGLFSAEVIRSQERDVFLTVMVDVTELKRAEEAQAALLSMIAVIGSLSELRDPYTAGHQRRVSQLAGRIALDMDMSQEDITDISMAGLVLDVGKISVPAEILSKPAALSSAEYKVVQGHAQAGYSVIADAHMHGPIAELVLQHHERCDGSGYPNGLVADEMLLGSKVLGVADTVEAMMSHRPYRAALGQERALEEIEQGAGRTYDAQVALSCLRVFRDEGFQFTEA